MKCRARSMRLRLRHAGEFEREGDVVGHGAPGEGRFLLEHHADRFVRAGDGLARDADARPRSWLSRPPMTLNKVDLPQPDGPITDKEFARLHVERDVVDRDDGAFRPCRSVRTMSSTTRMASVRARAAGIGVSRSLRRHHRGRPAAA